MYRIMLTFISGLAMIYTKSETGLHAIKDRHAVDITRAQRSALILFDGKRSLREVLDATASLGVTASDVEVLVASGLLQPSAGDRRRSRGGRPGRTGRFPGRSGRR